MIIPRLRSPIVLVHGLLGLNHFRPSSRQVVACFCGIDDALQEAGNRVYVPQLSPTGGVLERSAQLKAFLDREVPEEPVHLISHSMGGLDSRYLISRLGMADRVLSLTTLGTPHRGTPFADWGVRRFSRLAKPIFELLDVSHGAYYDLTTARCRAFNAEVPDAPGVRYFSVAARTKVEWYSVDWMVPYHIIAKAEGPNDGLVSQASAVYGEDCTYWDGDHLSLINWPSLTAKARGNWRDRIPDFGALVGRLKDVGF
jgi:triacylglycerol lipase